MINAIDIVEVGRDQNNHRIVDCLCVGDSASDAVPTSCASVTGLNENDVFAAGAVYFNVPNSETYVFGGRGVFVKVGG